MPIQYASRWIPPESVTTALEGLFSSLAGREEKGRDRVDTATVDLLGHEQVCRPQAGLDMRDRDALLCRREGTGQRGIGVADHYRHTRSVRSDPFRGGGQ